MLHLAPVELRRGTGVMGVECSHVVFGDMAKTIQKGDTKLHFILAETV